MNLANSGSPKHFPCSCESDNLLLIFTVFHSNNFIVIFLRHIYLLYGLSRQELDNRVEIFRAQVILLRLQPSWDSLEPSWNSLPISSLWGMNILKVSLLFVFCENDKLPNFL